MKETHNFDGGQPQYWPVCENYIGAKPWRTERGHIGVCSGCLGWVDLDVWGHVPEHEPADPPYFGCPNCGEPYKYRSYTNPPCDRCALKTDVAQYLRDGGSLQNVQAMWGELGAELAAEVTGEPYYYY
jgi:hypothetical protein